MCIIKDKQVLPLDITKDSLLRTLTLYIIGEKLIIQRYITYALLMYCKVFFNFFIYLTACVETLIWNFKHYTYNMLGNELSFYLWEFSSSLWFATMLYLYRNIRSDLLTMSSMSGNNLPQPIMLERSPQSATATAVPSANVKIYNSYRIQSTGVLTKLFINLQN